MTFPVLPANGPSGYNLTNSLRFRSSATAYLNRTLASTSSTTTWTWSGWYKRGALATGNAFFSASDGGGGSGYWCQMVLNSSDKLNFIVFSGGVGSISGNKTTTAVYRDPSAWYHIVFVFNTTSATAEDRMQIWVNGVRVTAWDTNTLISQNFAGYINNSTYVHELGALYYTPNTNFVDGYMAEVNFIDGQALTPSSFGSTNATTGVWQPAKYTGTYGTNGFYLPFTNTTSTTTLGNDFSGNGNNWTTNNISLTPGATYDAMTDVPTLTSATAANYPVLNPITSLRTALTNGNLTSGTGNTWSNSTIGVTSSKWYAEFTVATLAVVQWIGVGQNSPIANYNGFLSADYSYAQSGEKYNNNVGAAYGATYTSGDIIGVAFDADAGSLTFYKNGVSQGVAYSSMPFGTYYFQVYGRSTGGSSVVEANFGQRPFAYTPPSGFVALNTFNLPSSTIPAGNKFMDILLYTGTAPTPQTVTGLNFQTDFAWVKSRGYNTGHVLSNVIGGPTFTLSTDSIAAEYNGGTDNITAFNSNGITVGTADRVNRSGVGLVAWNWKAGGAGVTNTAGSITSTVSANTTSGFSVVTYTGTGANATVGHGLNVLPSMVIAKNRSGTSDWAVWHTSLGDNFMKLNTTNPQLGSTPNGVFNVASFTSSVFAVGNGIANVSASTYVAYCFAQIAGFSSFGFYTGNGSADGPFIYTGFRPRWIICKSTAEFGSWTIMDSARVGYNANNSTLYSDLTTVEQGYLPVDILSNGFKIRITSTGTSFNSSGEKYIYAAFAENPFKNALAR